MTHERIAKAGSPERKTIKGNRDPELSLVTHIA